MYVLTALLVSKVEELCGDIHLKHVWNDHCLYHDEDNIVYSLHDLLRQFYLSKCILKQYLKNDSASEVTYNPQTISATE